MNKWSKFFWYRYSTSPTLPLAFLMYIFVFMCLVSVYSVSCKHTITVFAIAMMWMCAIGYKHVVLIVKCPDTYPCKSYSTVMSDRVQRVRLVLFLFVWMVGTIESYTPSVTGAEYTYFVEQEGCEKLHTEICWNVAPKVIMQPYYITGDTFKHLETIAEELPRQTTVEDAVKLIDKPKMLRIRDAIGNCNLQLKMFSFALLLDVVLYFLQWCIQIGNGHFLDDMKLLCRFLFALPKHSSQVYLIS